MLSEEFIATPQQQMAKYGENVVRGLSNHLAENLSLGSGGAGLGRVVEEVKQVMNYRPELIDVINYMKEMASDYLPGFGLNEIKDTDIEFVIEQIKEMADDEPKELISNAIEELKQKYNILRESINEISESDMQIGTSDLLLEAPLDYAESRGELVDLISEQLDLYNPGGADLLKYTSTLLDDAGISGVERKKILKEMDADGNGDLSVDEVNAYSANVNAENRALFIALNKPEFRSRLIKRREYSSIFDDPYSQLINNDNNVNLVEQAQAFDNLQANQFNTVFSSE